MSSQLSVQDKQRLLRGVTKMVGDKSYEIACLPSILAAIAVVPVPQNGSRTMSFTFVKDLMYSRIILTGCVVKYG